MAQLNLFGFMSPRLARGFALWYRSGMRKKTLTYYSSMGFQNQKKLQETVHSVDMVTVVRADTKAHESITTDQLVPGDILVVPPHGCIMHCDAVLLSGNCIVNESMLTGTLLNHSGFPLSRWGRDRRNRVPDREDSFVKRN